jgi:hypothetical protein
MYDFSHRLLLTIVWAEIIKGLIVDEFSQMRSGGNFIEMDMKTTCFICGLKTDEFAKAVHQTFSEHTEFDHNCWDYVCYIAYIQEKRKSDLTGNEKYVWNNYLKKNIEWLPLKKSYFIDGDLDDIEVELRDSGEILGRLESIRGMMKEVSKKQYFNRISAPSE